MIRLVLLLFICSVIYICKFNLGANSKNVTKGYNHKDDTISVLLDRIQWSVHYPGRISFTIRYFFISTIIAFAVYILLFNKFPSSDGVTIVQLILVIWFFLMGYHSYFTVGSSLEGSCPLEIRKK